VEEDSTTKNNVYQDSICHEVKYDPTDKKSDTYKKYIKPFSHGTPEQWLKFMEDLHITIRGNGLDKNSLAHFNLTHSSLKDEALRIFNDKAAEQEEETRDMHIKCLRAITEHVFPKDNPLLKVGSLGYFVMTFLIIIFIRVYITINVVDRHSPTHLRNTDSGEILVHKHPIHYLVC
jgi:hypothetical protein